MRCRRKNMIDTLWTATRLRIAYRVNSIIYSLKQVPLLKRLLPIKLYASAGLKCFALICAIIWEILSMFFCNGLYLVVCMWLPMQMMALSYNAFAHVYLFLTIAGAVCNCRVFDPTKDKYYAIILMRMDARAYILTQHLYTILRIFIGTQCVLLFFIWYYHAPIQLCLLPFGVVGAKTISVAYSLRQYEQKGFVRNENAPVKWIWGIIAVCWFCAYGAFIPHFFVPVWIISCLSVLTMLIAVTCISYMWKYALYRPLAQQLLGQKNSAIQINKKTIVNDSYQNRISDDETITSNKKGYAYFNELFIKRHQRLLWRFSFRLTLITAGTLIVINILLWCFPQSHEEAEKVLLQYLPYLIFLVYSFHSGKSVIQAMFRNCDHSMLTYSFYRQKEVILSLFKLRLFDVIRINLLPAFVLGLGYAMLLYQCDSDNTWTGLIAIVSILGSSILFSIHYLTCYYLLQPYNAQTETKSSTYGIVMTITYIVCFAFIYLRVDAKLFGVLMILFSLLYGIIAYILIGKYASKTFRLRN